MANHVSIKGGNRPTTAEQRALLDDTEQMVFITPKARRCLEKLRSAAKSSKRRKRPVDPERLAKLQAGYARWNESVRTLGTLYQT